MIASIPAAARASTSGYKVDVGRGARVGRVSSEWFSRPDDERFLSLDTLFAAVNARSEQSRTRTVESAAVRVEASRDDPEALALILPGDDAPIAPTHWSFGQLAALVGAPAAYLRQLPAALAGINLQYGLTSHRPEQIKTLELIDQRIELRAATGPDYGRIHDRELVSAVQRIAGNGIGDTRWKIPGVLDWATSTYNPTAPVSKESTTLYASGERATAGLIARATGIGIDAIRLTPTHADLNDDLRVLEPAALSDALRPQLRVEDASRFGLVHGSTRAFVLPG